ncbi:MAG: DJ-1/PfpI family protein [Halolamina sp.]
MPSETTRVAIVCYEGFDELDAVGPYEVFRTANAAGAAVDADLVTVDGDDFVTASHGARIEPDGRLSAPAADDAPDVVLAPGGGWNDRAETGAWAAYQRGAVPEALAAHHEAGAVVGAVCTGAMLLAKAGLTDGRPAATHAGARDDLRESGAEVAAERVVDDGDLVTAGGVTSGLDLALHLVERFGSATVADDVATTIEYDRRFDVYEGD